MGLGEVGGVIGGDLGESLNRNNNQLCAQPHYPSTYYLFATPIAAAVAAVVAAAAAVTMYPPGEG